MPADIIQTIGKILIDRQQTIAVAESVTSGHIQAAISCAMDAAQFYQGGLTVYNLGQKSRHLFIDPIHAMSCNCVSEQVAREMALQVCHLFKSDWGLAVTGYASKVPESGNELFAFYSITHAGGIMESGRMDAPDDKPPQVQVFYTEQLLQKLANVLIHNS